MKRIFIGGLGRSGTTIALNALYRHGAVYAVPIETKFLVEEDGFADLVDAFTARFSIATASTAWQRFELLMRRQVTGLDDCKFREQHALSSDIFPGYEPALDAFIRLVQRRRYFAHRAPLLAGIRQFIAETFDAETRESDKSVWAEKTPSNIWRVPFLRELWPDCRIVHAMRDPRAVLLSLMQRRWLPRDPLAAATIFSTYLAALVDMRRTLANEPAIFELRLESLVADPAGTLAALAAALDLEPFTPEATAGLVGSMDTYYGTNRAPCFTLAADELDMVTELLRPAAVELGYPAHWQMPQ